jgi:FAD/FMN-containing dehydrogenase
VLAPARYGCTFTTQSRSEAAVTCKAAAARPSVSAGLVQSGGLGSFSKNYGTAAAGLLEAEVVTADGEARIVNRRRHPDLFWVLKGGGGGTFGVVTRLTLRTRELPAFFGRVFTSIKASSDAAFGRLVTAFVDFYAQRLFNSRWGESVTFGPGNILRIAMAFQGLDRDEAARVWQPFLDRFAYRDDFTVAPPPAVFAIPARQLWNPEALLRVPGLVTADDRPGAPEGNVFWTSTREEAGHFLHAYQSLWLPASLLGDNARKRLADALHAGSCHWPIALHFNKGLAGAPAEEVAAARETAMNPVALDAFALAISAAASAPAIPGVQKEADFTTTRLHAAAVRSAMLPLRSLAGRASYVSESDYFEADWQRSFWGPHYARLRAVKRRYDPEGLFIVHHGVGSEDWSDDGFTRNRATA